MIEVVELVLTAIGWITKGIYSIYFIIKSRKITRWHSVERGVLVIRRKIKESGWEPDIVIGLGCGGAVVGAMLAGSLGRKRIFVIDRRHKWQKGKRKTFVDTPADFRFVSEYKKALLISGEVCSGETMKLAVQHLQSKIRFALKTAAMYVCEDTNFYPDFYIYLVKERVKPPWRVKGYPRDSGK